MASDRQRIVFELSGLQIWEDVSDRELALYSKVPTRNIDQRVLAWRISTMRGTATCGLGPTNNKLRHWNDADEVQMHFYRKQSHKANLLEIELRVATLQQHIHNGSFGTVVPLSNEP